MRVKIEINTREHFNLYDVAEHPFKVDSSWFAGSAAIQSYSMPELLGTKLRALYQRKKGRDLFDLAMALEHDACDPESTVTAFLEYLAAEKAIITRSQFEANMNAKLRDPAFLNDITPLLRAELKYDASHAWSHVHQSLITLLPGEAWKGSGI